MTILYVDDDPDDRQLFGESVKTIDEDLVCVTARDGVEALAYLQHNRLPDVVFMDINMPLMDGKECLAEIRRSKRTSRLPVIIFTTSNSPGERGECEALGASDFIRKPLSFSDMTAILTSIFNSRTYLMI